MTEPGAPRRSTFRVLAWLRLVLSGIAVMQAPASLMSLARARLAPGDGVRTWPGHELVPGEKSSADKERCSRRQPRPGFGLAVRGSGEAQRVSDCWQGGQVRHEETMVAYRAFDVPVPGGSLHVGQWGGGPAVVAGVHGLTGTHMYFEALADQLGEAGSLLAPDLRGRGLSSAAGGPYGMTRHADDLIAVLDYAGVAEAVVVGHSMGGFVAVAVAARHPGRIRSLVLVDGYSVS